MAENRFDTAVPCSCSSSAMASGCAYQQIKSELKNVNLILELIQNSQASFQNELVTLKSSQNEMMTMMSSISAEIKYVVKSLHDKNISVPNNEGIAEMPAASTQGKSHVPPCQWGPQGTDSDCLINDQANNYTSAGLNRSSSISQLQVMLPTDC